MGSFAPPLPRAPEDDDARIYCKHLRKRLLQEMRRLKPTHVCSRLTRLHADVRAAGLR